MVSDTSRPVGPGEGDGVVRLFSTVRVREVEGEEEYTVVPSADALAAPGRVSLESPVGRALLGRRRGDRIEVRTPGGIRRLTIVAVTPPDTDLDRYPSARHPR
jgi:transcription elongation GreA/GreB family factor